MSYYYNGDPEPAAREKISTYRKAAALFPVVRKVVQEFDGKVINCRFEKALQAAAGRGIYAKKEWKYFSVYIYDKGNQITLASVPLDKLPDGKRLPAGLMIESAAEKRESLLKRAADMETAIEKVPVLKAHFKELEKLVSSLRDSIPYEIRDCYGLDYRLCR